MKLIKTIILISLITPIFALAQTSIAPTTPVSSDVTAPTAPDNTKETQGKDAIAGYRAATKAVEKLTKIKEAGANYIDARLSLLNQMITKIDKSTLSDAVKTELKNSINAEITSLTTLKSTLSTEPDLEKAKTEVRSIFSEHRVYMIFIPKEHGLAVVARLQTALTKFSGLDARIMNLINSAQTSGKDTAAAVKAYEDYKVQIKNLTDALTLANTKFTAMKVGDDATAKANLTAGKEALASAKTALTKIKADLDEIAKLK